MSKLLFEILTMTTIASLCFILISFLRPITIVKCTTLWSVNCLKLIVILFIFPISNLLKELKPNIILTNNISVNKIVNIGYTTPIEMQNFIDENIIIFSHIQNNSYLNIIDIISFTWVLGVISSFSWVFYCKKRFKNDIIKNCRNTTNINAINIVNNYKAKLNIKYDVELLESDTIKSPILISFLKPKIILPVKTIDDNLKYIILHELTHLKRKDLLWKNVLIIIKSLHWFNPIVYLLALEFDKNIEYLCDELVVKNFNHDKRKEYGFAILETIQNMNSPINGSIGVCFATNGLKIERRLTNMLNFKNTKKSSKIITGVLVFSLITMIAVPTFASNEVVELEDDFTIHWNTNINQETLGDGVVGHEFLTDIQTPFSFNQSISTMDNIDEWIAKIEDGTIKPNSFDHINDTLSSEFNKNISADIVETNEYFIDENGVKITIS